MSSKSCPRCQLVKHVTEFGNNRSSPDGKSCYCLVCCAAVQRAWKAANAEKVREWKRQYRQRLKEAA